MLDIKKILLPVDFPNASLAVLQEAATLARHFRSELVMLHVATPLSHAAGVPGSPAELASWDLLAEIIRQSPADSRQSLAQELSGLSVQRLVVEGDAAREIVRIAQHEKASLIMMPSHGQTFDRFLLGSVTAKVLHWTECPVWTGAHIEGASSQKFAIRNILCAVDFGLRTEQTVWWAAQMAAEFGARLTLAHVTASVEFWGPGGSHIDQGWKDTLVADATRRMADLQQSMNLHAEVFIGSGDVPKVLSQAATQTNADFLVTGCYPYGGHLRTNGYAIICAVPVPVLNV
jgi:nucleotide-binding universal stress UspA family protein